MSYIGVPVGNMLLEHVIRLGEAVLFPCYSFEDCIISEGVDSEIIDYLHRLFLENNEYYEDLARQGLCMLLFRTDDSVESIKNNAVVKNKILYTANRYLDYLIIQQCLYSRLEYLMNVAGQVGSYLYFDIIDENYKVQEPIIIGNKYYSMQPGLGLDVSDVYATAEDKLYNTLYSGRTDEVYNEYRAILGHACDAMRIGDINRCFSYLFTKVERMGHCDEYRFQRNKVRIISCLSENQDQFDMNSSQLYFYSKQIRTDIIHKGVNFLEQIPLKDAHRVINDLLALIIRFCIVIIDTGIDTFASLDTYLTQQEVKYQYVKPQETRALASNTGLEKNRHVYAACISNMNLSEPIKVGNIIFLPESDVFSFTRYYWNYVKKDCGRDDYDEVFEDFSVEDLEYIIEILKHGKFQNTAIAIILQQPYLPPQEEGPNGYEFLCDYICKEIEKGLSCFLLVSNEWQETGALPSKVGVLNQIRAIWRYDEQIGELRAIPGRVYQGYFEPSFSYKAPDRLTVSSSVMYDIFSSNGTDIVGRMCKTALERVCDSYYMDDLNLRIIYLFDILDMLHPDTTSGEELRKRVLAYTCNSRKEYEEQTEVFINMRNSKRNPIIHGGKSIYDLVDSIEQIHADCDLLERWIIMYCKNVIQLNISTMEDLKQLSTYRRNSFR